MFFLPVPYQQAITKYNLPFCSIKRSDTSFGTTRQFAWNIILVFHYIPFHCSWVIIKCSSLRLENYLAWFVVWIVDLECGIVSRIEIRLRKLLFVLKMRIHFYFVLFWFGFCVIFSQFSLFSLWVLFSYFLSHCFDLVVTSVLKQNYFFVVDRNGLHEEIKKMNGHKYIICR